VRLSIQFGVKKCTSGYAPEFGFGRGQLNVILILKDAHNLISYFFPKMTCCRLQNDEDMVEFASTPQNLYL